MELKISLNLRKRKNITNRLLKIIFSCLIVEINFQTAFFMFIIYFVSSKLCTFSARFIISKNFPNFGKWKIGLGVTR